MNKKIRNLILISILIVVIGAVIGLRVLSPNKLAVTEKSVEFDENLPSLFEFGAGTCVPCKQMKPVLEEVKKLYAGKVNIISIDTNLEENKGAREKYRYKFEPTQIIFNKDDKELTRHMGFWAKQDIEQKLLELGLITELAKPAVVGQDKESSEEAESDGIAATFFNNLESWIKENFWLGILVVFAWGLISVIFSPCQLSTIPLVVGYVGGYTTGGVRKSFLYSLAFVVGIFIPMFIFAVFLYQVMYLLQDIGPLFFGGLLILMGLYLLNLLPLNFKPPAQKNEKKGALGAFILGILYGIFVTGPCSLAFMAPVLGVVESGENWFYGVVLIFIFSVAHCLPILAAGTATGWVNSLLSSKKMGAATTIFRFAAGALIFLLGFYFLALK